ncbi:hypothetical protein DSL72_000824 [Monilinia vaccinii-corymbosi]|uniref:chitinase n=1 Tax=Monilinia vaccinii-corymbosi TaxID=61207 RepID=A0A8A3P6X2_9HELO|nr:hypothetical protein DSL72_000824 [Monilinia vaccinii-corymbosi]
MYSSKTFTVAAATFALIAPSVALYDAFSPTNLALYWGSGPYQANLSYYCEQSTVDIIPLAFMNVFPAQGDGYPAENFGNACYGQPIFTPGPGYPLGDVDTSKDQLYVQCPGIQEGIPYCQSLGKKILLSLGGASTTYQLTGAADGQYFADFLWGSYGLFKQSWLDAGGIRPMDGGYYGTDPNIHIDIDGFDFDIEITPTDSSEGYIAMINRLREHFAENPSKKYFISGAPQCPIPEPNMGAMIAGAKFDLLWIQFYNNEQAQCTARQWADNYASTGQEFSAEFTYDQWVSTINSGASAGASIYLGLLGSPLAGTATDYISPLEAQELIDSYQNKPQFGGVMIWEATYSQENTDAELNGQSYHAFIKSCLSPHAPPLTSRSSVVSTTTTCGSSSTSEAPITSSAPSSTFSGSSIYSSESSAAPSSISSDVLITPSLTSTFISESSAAPSSTSHEISTTSSSASLLIAESPAVQSSSHSESVASPSISSSLISPTPASSRYSIPEYSHNATSHLTHSSKPAGISTLPVQSSKPTGSYAFTAHSSTSTISHSSNSHSTRPSSKPSSAYTAPEYTSISTFSSESKTKAKTETETEIKTKASSIVPSGNPVSSSSIVVSSTALYGNNTYSHSKAKPAPTSTSSAEGVTVLPSSSTQPGSTATESTVVGSSTTGASEISSGPVTSGGYASSATGSASVSVSTSSGSGSITSVAQYITSTAYVTTVYTITSCAATVTDCPARSGKVTTETISSYTSVYSIDVSSALVNVPSSEASTAAGALTSITLAGESSAPGVSSPVLTLEVSSPAGVLTSVPVLEASSITLVPSPAPTLEASFAAGVLTLALALGASSSFPSLEVSSAAGSLTSLSLVGASSASEVSLPIPTSEAEATSPTSHYTTIIPTPINCQTTTKPAIIAISTITVVPVPMASTILEPPYDAGDETLVASGSASLTPVPKPSSYVTKVESQSTTSAVPRPTAFNFEASADRVVGKVGVGLVAGVAMLGFLIV